MEQQKGLAGFGVCLLVRGVLEGLTADYIEAAFLVAGGVFFILLYSGLG